MKRHDIYTLPILIWLSLFFTIPLSITVIMSFMSSTPYGGVTLPFTVGNYVEIMKGRILAILWRTIWISALSTLITLGLSLPVSFFMATSRWKNLLLMATIIPFWTNFIIRIFAWIFLLGNNGMLNNILIQLGIVKNPITFLYNSWAVVVVIVYTYLPYMILPIYSAMEKFDFSMIDAAMDLGATKIRAIFKVMFPSIKGGITAGILFVFIPALGSYAIPELVGGRDSVMLGNLIAWEITTARNWPYATALSNILFVSTALALFLYLKIQGSDGK